MQYFTNVKNLEELRKEYKRLLRKYHPDNGGDEETAKIINLEYEQIFKRLKENSGESEEKYDSDLDEALREVLKKIIHLNVNIEICGEWIWVTGETYPVKSTLYEVGLKFAKKKKAWYWHQGDFKKKKGKVTLDEIRRKYGSEKIKEEEKTERYYIA